MSRARALLLATAIGAGQGFLFPGAPALAAEPRAAECGAFGDEAVRYDAQADRVALAAWGVAPAHAASLGQVSAASRRAARKRVLRALHHWIDVALREQSSSPPLLTRVHAAAEAAVQERGARFLADGTVVLCVELPGAALREVFAEAGVPWAR